MCKEASQQKALADKHAKSLVIAPNSESAMSMKTKPSIVFAHGLWADGSCFSKVISTLQAHST